MRNWQFLSWSRNSPHFMEPEGSLTCSQQPAPFPYPVPDQSSPRPSQAIYLIASYHLRLSLLRSPFPSGFPIKNLYAFLFSPILVKCPAYLIFLNFINLPTFDEECRSRNSSLSSCSSLSHTPSYAQIIPHRSMLLLPHFTLNLHK
jgi:hypothetical protein